VRQQITYNGTWAVNAITNNENIDISLRWWCRMKGRSVLRRREGACVCC
jgi:hypothetical protein